MTSSLCGAGAPSKGSRPRSAGSGNRSIPGLLAGIYSSDGIKGTLLAVVAGVFGVGYESITDALMAKLTIQAALGLLVFKLLATSLTLGSGGSGGVFAPSLFLGAVFGAAFGGLVHAYLPGVTASPGAYAVVGMAAVFTGAAHAPITAILIVFEMTRDYKLILPLMIAVVISMLVTQSLSPQSIYTLKLLRRGRKVRPAESAFLRRPPWARSPRAR